MALEAPLSLPGVVNPDKVVLYEALTIVAEKNLDFVDGLLYAKRKLQGYAIESFDHDFRKCQ